MRDFYEKVFQLLTKSEVEFIVVGGVSAVLQGAPIVTRDLDICFRRTPENLRKLAEALAPLQPTLRNFPPDLPFVFDERALGLGTNFTLMIGNEELDLLGDMIAIGGYEQLIKAADLMEVAGMAIYVLPLNKLIATKRAAGRPKDLATIPLLEATLATKSQQIPPAHDTTPGQ